MSQISAAKKWSTPSVVTMVATGKKPCGSDLTPVEKKELNDIVSSQRAAIDQFTAPHNKRVRADTVAAERNDCNVLLSD